VGADVIRLPRSGAYDPVLTYRQLACALAVSERFLRYRHAEGMPDEGFDYAGRRVFRLSEVVAWLDGRQERMGRIRMGDADSAPEGRST
jgi:hypothetical protein